MPRKPGNVVLALAMGGCLAADAEPVIDERSVELQIDASAMRDGDEALVVVEVAASGPDGEVVSGVVPTVGLAVGIDVDLAVEMEEVEPGRFVGEVRTDIAGTGEIHSMVEAGSEEAFELVAIPPGAIEELEATVGPWALPDGLSSVEVIVAATDAVGNSAGVGYSEFVVETELEFEMAYNDCNEAVFRFSATAPGLFPVLITEVGTGLTTAFEVPFALAGVRRPIEGHFYTALDEPRALAMPVEAYVPQAWAFETAWLELEIDAGLVAIGGPPTVRDADPDDCAHPQAEFFPSETDPNALTGNVFIVIDPPGEGGCIRKPKFEFWLDFETGTQDPPANDEEVAGGARVAAVEGDAPHPATAKLRWVDGVGLAVNCTCKKATVYKGCVMYVRTPPGPDGMQHTDETICTAHDRANVILDQACVSLDKKFANVSVVGKPVEGPLNTKTKMGNALRYAAGVVDPGDCLMVLLTDEAKAKGQRYKPDNPGTTRQQDPAVGGMVIERGAVRNGRTLAHELGHSLGLAHTGNIVDRKARLMTPADGGPGRGWRISDGERQAMRQSGWLTAQEGKKYSCN